ncbi:chaperone modulator CbpM [Paraglaciecola sp. L3A3]|uniref:chaperone modulator CbpM n=1 Tax=Paraglaciecola sp. L3A3 TaxID=2686358 RepID=UPI00131DBD45|nr:chaperone modulator CbpM [Paraglaciecola sp. L3A3]
MQIIVSQQDNILTSQELCLSSDINEGILYELVEHSIAIPLTGEHVTEWQFTVATVTLVKKAARIQHDLSLDWSAIPLVLQLLDERDELIAENKMLKQHLSRFKS